MRTRLMRGKITLLFMTCAVLLAVPTIALADDLRNNIDNSFDANFEVLTLPASGASQNVNVVLQTQGSDGDNGCNLDGSEKIQVQAVSSSSAASVKWALTGTDKVDFLDCGASNSRNLTVTPGSSAGSTNVTFKITSTGATESSTQPGVWTVPITGTGTYDLNTARFTVNVTPPPNTPPSVSVTGVTHGVTYDKGAVPAAGCSVSDAEDTGESATPVKDSSLLDSDGLGLEKVTCSYTDGGGLTTTASATYTIRDPSGPVITKSVTGTEGNNGWYTSNVTVDWTVSDPESPNSLQLTGCVDQNITSDQAATTYSCSATSAGGSAPEQSVTIKRDATKPSTTATPDRSADHNGWYTHAVTFSFQGTDATSGIASCSADRIYNGPDGSNLTVNGSCTDNAGNSSDPGVSSSFNYDGTAPDNVAGTLNRTADQNGWYNDAVGYQFTGNDPTSGIDICTSGTYSGPDGSGLTVPGTCTDKAGNQSASVDTAAFKYDSTAPTNVSGDPARAADHNGWYTSSVNIAFSGDDATSGIASCSTVPYDSPDGDNITVNGSCTDNAGNSTNGTSSAFKYDATAPSATASPDRSADQNGWYNHAVTISFDGQDATSGIDSCSDDRVYDGPDSGTASVSGTCTDNAGNQSDSDTFNFKYDDTAPALTSLGATTSP
ncbi:MAG: hypothetical protein M3437_20545, partial [Chloroflexota bacterium]|nr:hypothetical protein [Chloroflexota bacterium]